LGKAVAANGIVKRRRLEMKKRRRKRVRETPSRDGGERKKIVLGTIPVGKEGKKKNQNVGQR